MDVARRLQDPVAGHGAEHDEADSEKEQVDAVLSQPGCHRGRRWYHRPALAPDSGKPDHGAPGWQRFRPLVGALPALILALVALWEIVAIARAGSDVPTAGDWQRAAEAVRAEHESGDLIVFAPSWLDPVGRQHLGDLIPIEMAARMDGARYGRVWELSARGARAPEARGEVVLSETFGELTVRRYQRPAAEIVTDFVEAFSPGGGRVRGSAQVELQEVGFTPRRCVVARPAPDRTVTILYPKVALGSELVGYVGLADIFNLRDHRQPGRLEVLIDGKQVATTTVGVDDGWVKWQVATEPAAEVDVEFRATAVGPKALKRWICFAAEARQ
jgi:hypothetical protein